MTEQCPACASAHILSNAGDGKCSGCYGSGTVGNIADDIGGGKRNCSHCAGTGVCHTCGGHGSIAVRPKPRPHANAELNPFDEKSAIKTICPNCGAMDWFQWRFLGKLVDPVCSHSWYVGSGTYALMQFRAAFQAGRRFSKYMTSGTSGEAQWIARFLGWFMGTLLGIGFRLEFGILMIPIQAVVGLCQPKQAKGEAFSRSVVVGTFLVVGCSIAYLAANNVSAEPLPQTSVAKSSVQKAADEAVIGTFNYHNRRYGFTLSYPANFQPQGESANGDGQEFVSDDRAARLAVWGSTFTSHPEGKLNLNDSLQLTAATPGLTVTYKVLRKNFFVVSGYLGNDILYERVTLRNNIFWGFRLLYDQRKRASYDKLPAILTTSLQIPPN